MADQVRTPEYDAILAGVIAAPEDDAARLALADWLQEHGREERADFIRVQCRLAAMTEAERQTPEGERLRAEQYRLRDACIGGLLPDLRGRTPVPDGWSEYSVSQFGIRYQTEGDVPSVTVTLRRGFIAEVWLSRAALLGGACEVCDATGSTSQTTRGGSFLSRRCPWCDGEGGVADGVAADLFRGQPIEHVDLVDYSPFALIETPGCHWYRADDQPTDSPESHLPPDLFDELPGQPFPPEPDPDNQTQFKEFDTLQGGIEALSALLIRHGRAAADAPGEG